MANSQRSTAAQGEESDLDRVLQANSPSTVRRSLTFTSLQEPEPSDDPVETDSIDLRLSTLETLRDKLRRINMAARSLAASQNSATQDTPSDPEPSHVRAEASGAQNADVTRQAALANSTPPRRPRATDPSPMAKSLAGLQSAHARQDADFDAQLRRHQQQLAQLHSNASDNMRHSLDTMLRSSQNYPLQSTMISADVSNGEPATHTSRHAPVSRHSETKPELVPTTGSSAPGQPTHAPSLPAGRQLVSGPRDWSAVHASASDLDTEEHHHSDSNAPRDMDLDTDSEPESNANQVEVRVEARQANAARSDSEPDKSSEATAQRVSAHPSAPAPLKPAQAPTINLNGSDASPPTAPTHHSPLRTATRVEFTSATVNTQPQAEPSREATQVWQLQTEVLHLRTELATLRHKRQMDLLDEEDDYRASQTRQLHESQISHASQPAAPAPQASAPADASPSDRVPLEHLQAAHARIEQLEASLRLLNRDKEAMQVPTSLAASHNANANTNGSTRAATAPPRASQLPVRVATTPGRATSATHHGPTHPSTRDTTLGLAAEEEGEGDDLHMSSSRTYRASDRYRDELNASLVAAETSRLQQEREQAHQRQQYLQQQQQHYLQQQRQLQAQQQQALLAQQSHHPPHVPNGAEPYHVLHHEELVPQRGPISGPDTTQDEPDLMYTSALSSGSTMHAHHANEECDFNIFTGEPRTQANMSFTDKKRNRLDPQTRMAWADETSMRPANTMTPGRNSAYDSEGPVVQGDCPSFDADRVHCENKPIHIHMHA
ncbi:uncharacterized protein MONBRDRAFT_11315 [Monosiga brevicollis MX1]|uniref:Uncharacterized protein n=1 Tax=Monosiga brevicollis TaxID=81824 RepID=A9V8V6_MONBE|nr:uncharacterized protein MONBRDRAFT_11315 [Monosiga brevicollis MX1]EDQ86026.1 predicted protein [Monosiga brevicollis MX1]|eukprot:XP_001749220.1 hypothetical protein [Monosiga brevicollis MX1]